MHTMPKCTPRAVLKHLLGSHIPYEDYCGESPCTFGVRWAILLASDGLFHHTGLLSKSSAEGINIQNHDCRNCDPSSTIVGYVAFYSQSAPCLFPTPIALN